SSNKVRTSRRSSAVTAGLMLSTSKELAFIAECAGKDGSLVLSGTDSQAAALRRGIGLRHSPNRDLANSRPPVILLELGRSCTWRTRSHSNGVQRCEVIGARCLPPLARGGRFTSRFPW